MLNKPVPITDLYDKLIAFQFPVTDNNCTFEKRLATENDWSEEYVKDVIVEYKRFLFLAANSPTPLSPSEDVDQVWHLHLIYSYSYWNDLCENILRFPFHHQPSTGGIQEADKFFEWYSNTLKFYEETFHETPPIVIWPLPIEEFKDDIEKIKKQNKACIGSTLVWIGILLFALFMTFKFELNVVIVFCVVFIAGNLLHYGIIGYKCESCCRFHAMKKIASGGKKIWTCKYCNYKEKYKRREGNIVAGGGGGDGSGGGDGGGCGGACGGCGGG